MPSFNEKADVYSMGIVMWEVRQGGIPFKGIPDANLGIMVLTKEARPKPIPSGAPAALVQLMQRCWAQKPADRPVFDKVATELERLPRGSQREGSEEAAKKRGSLERKERELATQREEVEIERARAASFERRAEEESARQREELEEKRKRMEEEQRTRDESFRRKASEKEKELEELKKKILSEAATPPPAPPSTAITVVEGVASCHHSWKFEGSGTAPVQDECSGLMARVKGGAVRTSQGLHLAKGKKGYAEIDAWEWGGETSVEVRVREEQKRMTNRCK